MSAVSHISPVEELADFLASSPISAEVASFHLSSTAIAHARELMDKNKAGTLTAEEEHELDQLILLDDIIGLIRSRIPRGVGDTPQGEATQSNAAICHSTCNERL